MKSPNGSLHVATYNIHKGLSLFNRRLVIHELRDRLRLLGADIVFLQEVQGTCERKAARHEEWPVAPQYEFLADTVWGDFAYGRNAVYDHGHHGNAISRAIRSSTGTTRTCPRHGSRSAGSCTAKWRSRAGTRRFIAWRPPRLTSRGRSCRSSGCASASSVSFPRTRPIVAGDFNDWHWRHKATHELAHRSTCTSLRAGERTAGAQLPAMLPVFRLDRIYGAVSREPRSRAPWPGLGPHPDQPR